tara:strand:- start:50 stop:361 length:312 start_codon:yes stop_codon:yes gene_type:complete
MVFEMNIENWDAICSTFQDFFEKLGVIEITDSYVSFSSYPDDVITHFRINSDGMLSASMPLHGIGIKINNVEFDKIQNRVRTNGVEINYEYQVPKNILRRRSD